jgi:hypothetical protein
MNAPWLPHAILRAASLLAPGEQRAAWLGEWQSELWYIAPGGAARFCLGAFQDAWWIRRNRAQALQPASTLLDSPLRCLALLAALTAVCALIALCIPMPQNAAPPSRLRLRDLPMISVVTLPFTLLILPATRFAMQPAPANRHPLPWPSRLWRISFLILKIVLVQPIMFTGFVVIFPLHTVPMTLGLVASWILMFRWVISDQRSRCPVCLRRLSNPVRIGSPSQTFLEWYGAESMCPRGHGLRQASETGLCSQNSQWLGLGNSWSGLFSAASRGRHG